MGRRLQQSRAVVSAQGNKVPAAAALAVVALTALVIFLSPTGRGWWGDRWDAIFGMTTVALAAILFVMGMGTRWVNGLPLRLSVEYRLVTSEDQTVPFMIVRDVPLAGEADIRGFSQQIAGQMSERMGVPVPANRYVPFKPFNEIGASSRVHDREQGWFVRHRAQFYVAASAPQDHPERTYWSLDADGRLRWGPSGSRVYDSEKALTDQVGLLVWWNNLADRPLNDEAWFCAAHTESVRSCLTGLAEDSSLILVRGEEGHLLFATDGSTAGQSAVDPAKQTTGSLECGCYWNLAYSRAAQQESARAVAD